MSGRLAPTPSGTLHVGNALAFAGAWLSARAAGIELLLRMEDVDTIRSRPHLERGIRRDLDWLGLTTDRETPRQSERDYLPWLDLLDTYFCACSRKELAQRPCVCKTATHTEGAIRWRCPAGSVQFVDRRWGPTSVDPAQFGDPVLRRRDGIYAYPLAVVVDDLVDGVTEVVRGSDLLSFTAVQIRLWEALGATPPTYLHMPLIEGGDGRKLSKSQGSISVSDHRDAGTTPEELWAQLLPFLGLESTRLCDATSLWCDQGGELGPVTWPAPGYDNRRR